MPTYMNHGYSNSLTDLDRPIETYIRSILCHRLFEWIGAKCVFAVIILSIGKRFNGSIRKLPFKNILLTAGKNVYRKILVWGQGTKDKKLTVEMSIVWRLEDVWDVERQVKSINTFLTVHTFLKSKNMHQCTVFLSWMIFYISLCLIKGIWWLYWNLYVYIIAYHWWILQDKINRFEKQRKWC